MNPSNEHDIQEEVESQVEQETVEETPAAPVSKAEAKAEKEEETRKADKRSNLMYILIAVAFVVIGAAAIIYNTIDSEKTIYAATINDQEYSVAEVNYHYINSYQSFMNSYGDYVSYFGLDTSSSFKTQYYTEDQTWYEYFLEQALYQLSSVTAMVAAAEAEGFVYSDYVSTTLESTIADLEMYAPYYGYTDAEDYLIANYGSTMTMDVYKELLTKSLQAEEYAYSYQDSLVYDDATLEAAYAADPTTYDMVDYELVYVYNAVATTDADGNAIEVTDEMTAEANAEAEAVATMLYDDYSAGASLSSVADTSDLAYYYSQTGGSYSGDAVTTWLYDDARKTGDSTLLEDSGTYYIISFMDRYREEYNLIDVRHILVMPSTGILTAEDEGYQEELDSLDAAAASQAQYVLDEFLASDMTEETFASMANTYSEDTGSNTAGGLYEMVAKGEMVATFEDWCFDSSRQVGDTGLIETDYGYHVMYFVGESLPYWEALVTNTLLSNDFSTWFEGHLANYPAVATEDAVLYVGF